MDCSRTSRRRTRGSCPTISGTARHAPSNTFSTGRNGTPTNPGTSSPATLTDHIGSADVALIFDDIQILKKGNMSVGVAPKHYGLTGDVATYASDLGHAYAGRELHVPGSWAADPARREAAGMPGDWEFATKREGMNLRLYRAGADRLVPRVRPVAQWDRGARRPGAALDHRHARRASGP
ncbi:transposase [Frankia sp. Cj5]|uniref:transposase n=1 Tax=Frankia sp. Cj5 TaxID=2880978 RepID=UPI001EF7167C|nr:transposase [Frankia sp. Cj5]